MTELKANPIVSIILPTYNRASLIGETIRSVLNQTFNDFELIIVDDGSTDNTFEVVNSAGSNKIVYISIEHHERSHARNVAITAIKGKYVAFIDSDDLFLPEKLAVQVAYLDSHPEAGMVYNAGRVIDGDGNLTNFTYSAVDSGWLYKKLAFYVPLVIILPCVMMRANVLNDVGNFDETLNRFEDTDYWRRVSKKYQIHAIPQVLSVIRTHSGNELANQDIDRIFHSMVLYIQKVFAEDKDQGRVFLNMAASRFALHYGRTIYANPRLRIASRKFISYAIILWPPQILAYAFLVDSYLGGAFYSTYKRIKRL